MIALILLIALPLIEIAVMIKVGQLLGFWLALAIVLVTFAAGAVILGRSGLTSAWRVREALVRGEPPVAAMLESALVVVGAILLITPGYLADVTGLLLMLPPVRTWLAGLALRNAMMTGTVEIRRHRVDVEEEMLRRPREAPRDRPPPAGGPVIEGEYERLDERPVEPERPRRERGPGT